MILLSDLCYLSWKEAFGQRTEFTGMGNLLNEYSEQSVLLADPSKNHSSPFCSSLSASFSLWKQRFDDLCLSYLLGKYCFGPV